MINIVAMIGLALAIAGCEHPELAVENDGGKAPVLCLRKDNESHMYFCRDADRRVWVCNDNSPAQCALVARIKTTLDGVLPERPSP